jgi:hypothetical protein
MFDRVELKPVLRCEQYATGIAGENALVFGEIKQVIHQEHRRSPIKLLGYQAGCV